MGALFARLRGGGGGSREEEHRPSRVTDQDRAVLSLKQQRDKLQRYQKKLNKQMVDEKELARRLLREGKKEKAKLLLKKKRYLESLLEKTDTQLDNLQQMVDNIEFAQIELKVVEGLKQGNEALEQMHKLMSIEDVEKIMEETEDAIEYQRQIDELLGQNMTQEDEDAIAEELESIILGQLPEVPATGAAVGEEEEEDITAQLPEVPTEPPTLETAPVKSKQKREAVPA